MAAVKATGVCHKTVDVAGSLLPSNAKKVGPECGLKGPQPLQKVGQSSRADSRRNANERKTQFDSLLLEI